MVSATTSLTGFSGEPIWPLGQLRLLVTIGDAEHYTRSWMNFMIVRSPSPYNGIIERPGIREIQAVPSTAHRMLKFSVNGRIVTIRSTILTPTEWDAEHYTRSWMNFMIVRSPSPYNGIIERPGIREIQAVPSTAHRMLKFSVNGGIVTIRSTILTPTECTTIAGTPKVHAKKAEARHENFKVEYHDRLSSTNSISEKDIPLSDRKNRPGPGERQGNPSRGTKTGRGRDSARSILPRLVIQPSHGEEARCRIPLRLTIKCFMEAYKGYHQIQMAEQDEKKTAFHTSHRTSCSEPRDTRGRLGHQVSHRNRAAMDIEATLCMLRKINMKLNPKKCKLGAAKGMFLGYMINSEVIKPCPDKTDVVLQLPSSRTIKEVQSLNGKLASLNRFISKSAEKYLPLFKTLKKCIKKTPKPKEELIMYLSASYEAISTVLMTERDTVQTPVYFVSRALQAPELNYTPMEKLVMALVCATKRLCRYFQAHLIVVITDQPIKQVMSHPDILADFVVEKPDDAPPDTSVIETPQEPWTLLTDGSSCVDGSGAGLILTSPERTEFTYALRFQFIASNNEAKYEALIAGLRIAAQIGVRNVH
nr:hypothetical protein [Tanacetum cinerariifolium]